MKNELNKKAVPELLGKEQIIKQDILSITDLDLSNLDTGRLNRIHEHIEGRIRDRKIAGAISIVAKDNKFVHFEAQGFADIETGRHLEKNSIFRLASMTKPIVGIAVLILAEEGRLGIDDPLSKFIPEYRNMKVSVPDTQAPPTYKSVPADREITLRDLLSHSSGLGHGEIGNNELSKLMPKPGDTLANHIPLWAEIPLDFQPGTQTGYSGLAAFNILGRVVELASVCLWTSTFPNTFLNLSE